MAATQIAKPFHRPGTAALRALPAMTLILAGEVAIFDDTPIARFEWFRKRPEDIAATPPVYMAFDCLYLEGLRDLRLRERRLELERVLENDQVLLFPARRLGADGLDAWAQVIERGYEGLVGKDEASWLKVKVPKYRESDRGWDPKR